MTNNGCGNCGAERAAPMLRDEAWLRLAAKHEVLCSQCMFQRASDRNVRLNFPDLLPCGFNLFHHPFSWFALFRGPDAEAPPISDEWRDAAQTLGMDPERLREYPDG